METEISSEVDPTGSLWYTNNKTTLESAIRSEVDPTGSLWYRREVHTCGVSCSEVDPTGSLWYSGTSIACNRCQF